ncbi:MAG: tetratricopeptide repeat protein [Chloroflexi bacterium]|nr:tetratricopeptide repeat protein [Chloroflexota bacterium]
MVAAAHRWLLAGLLALLMAAPPPTSAAPAWLRAGDQRLAAGDILEAELAYGRAEAAGAPTEELWLRKGLCLLAEARPDDAEAAFGQVVGGPRLAEAWIGRGDVWARRGDFAAAAAWWQAAVGQGASPEGWLRLGWAELRRGRFWQAQEALGRAWEGGEQSCAASYGLAALWALADTAAAARWLQAPCSAPDDPHWTWWPAAHPGRLQTEALAAALAQADRADDEPGRAAALGTAFTRLGLHPLAERAWLAAVQGRPSWGAAWAYLGHARLAQGRPALDALEQAVALEPDSPLGWYFLGRWFMVQGVPQAALAPLQQGLVLDPNNAGLLLELAAAHLALGDYPAALRALDEAVAQQPDDAAIWFGAARLTLEHLLQVPERGLPAAERALILAPDHAAAHDLVGWGAWLSGDEPRARWETDLALRLDPTLASAWYHKAVQEAAQERALTARQAYMRAVRHDPEGFYGDRAARALREMQARSGPGVGLDRFLGKPMFTPPQG